MRTTGLLLLAPLLVGTVPPASATHMTTRAGGRPVLVLNMDK